MRRVFAAVLLVVLGWTPVLPAFAFGDEGDAGLPACCRKDGQHHCAMSGVAFAAMQSGTVKGRAGREVMVRSLRERCPYGSPAAVNGTVRAALGMVTAGDLLPMVSHPAGVVQTESRWRVARERARGKRGPPPVACVPDVGAAAESV